jgi:hypothetical protein
MTAAVVDYFSFPCTMYEGCPVYYSKKSISLPAAFGKGKIKAGY